MLHYHLVVVFTLFLNFSFCLYSLIFYFPFYPSFPGSFSIQRIKGILLWGEGQSRRLEDTVMGPTHPGKAPAGGDVGGQWSLTPAPMASMEYSPPHGGLQPQDGDSCNWLHLASKVSPQVGRRCVTHRERHVCGHDLLPSHGLRAGGGGDSRQGIMWSCWRKPWKGLRFGLCSHPQSWLLCSTSGWWVIRLELLQKRPPGNTVLLHFSLGCTAPRLYDLNVFPISGLHGTRMQGKIH